MGGIYKYADASSDAPTGATQCCARGLKVGARGLAVIVMLGCVFVIGCEGLPSPAPAAPLTRDPALVREGRSTAVIEGDYARLPHDIYRTVRDLYWSLAKLDAPQAVRDLEIWEGRRSRRRSQGLDVSDDQPPIDASTPLADLTVRATVMVPESYVADIEARPLGGATDRERILVSVKVGRLGQPDIEATIINELARMLSGKPAPWRYKSYELPKE